MLKKKKSLIKYDKSLENYFNEIKNNKPLSKDEEYDLWKKYKYENDISARNKLVSSNLKFVANVAKNFQGYGLPYSDLISEGNVGLIKAMDKFEGDKGNKIISYSVWWIRQSIMEALEKRNLINAEDFPLDYENQELEDEYNENFNNEAIISDNETFNELDEIDTEMIHEFLKVLNEKEQTVIKKYYGINCKQMTMESIGKEYGVTKERIRQMIEKCLKRMRSEALKICEQITIY